MRNLTVRVADENGFKCWKEEKTGFVWYTPSGKPEAAVNNDLML